MATDSEASVSDSTPLKDSPVQYWDGGGGGGLHGASIPYCVGSLRFLS